MGGIEIVGTITSGSGMGVLGKADVIGSVGSG
jgi:hypothetical protein